MKKFFLVVLFFLVTSVTFGLSLMTLGKVNGARQANLAKMTTAPAQLFAALPQRTGEVLGMVTATDARPLIIEKYLQKYASPLFPHAQELFLAAEKYNVDYRLIVAIAQCESNLCKKSPPGSYNCWGFENGETHFLSWDQALDQVAKTLREGYLNYGLTTPEQIMPKYAPPSVEKGGPWAKCVNQFINDLEYGKVE